MKSIATLVFAGLTCILIMAFDRLDITDKKQAGSSSDIFEGTSSCASSARSFLQIPGSNKCDYVKWKVVLNYNQKTREPVDFRLTREYSFYIDNRTSQSLGSTVIHGKWEILKGTPSLPEATVYRLHSGRHSLSFIKVDENLIHLLEPDRSLSSAVSVQSFTLNRTGDKRVPSGKLIKVSTPMSNSRKEGKVTFIGRTPCKEITREANIKAGEDCFKLKWLLTLYFDPKTKQPSVYELNRTLHRQSLIKGKWTIIKGSPSDPNAIIYQLDPDKPKESILLLRGDDNVLFFLDKSKHPLVGNAEFSYTLNRQR